MFNFNATFIVAMLSFVVFIMIMNTIFYAPILNIIKKREEYIETNYSESKEFENKTEEYKNTHAQKIKNTQDVCRQDFKEKIAKIQKNAAEEIKTARENSKNGIKIRKEELLQKETTLKEDIQNSVMNDLTKAVTDKILGGIAD